MILLSDGKLWVTAVSGGPRQEFWGGPIGRRSTCRFSPDGSMVAAATRNEVWLLPYPSGSPRKLTTEPESRLRTGVNWFPDGRTLLVGEDAPGSLVRYGIDGSRRGIYASPDLDPSTATLSPDGKRIAYTSGTPQWSVVELSLADGTWHTAVGGGGVVWWPDWAPSGTHFLFTSGRRNGADALEDLNATGDPFSRRLIEGGGVNQARWSPDGNRIVYTSAAGSPKLMLANGGGAQAVVLDSDVNRLAGPSWSPDGQWVAYLRTYKGRQEAVKCRAVPGAAPVMLAEAAPLGYSVAQWSPSGDSILFPASDGLRLVSPETKATRLLTARKLLVYNFSRDGRSVYGIWQDTTGSGAQWQLFSIDVQSGAEKRVAAVQLPLSVSSLAGFSVHPDGKRVLTSMAQWPFDIWMLEGF